MNRSKAAKSAAMRKKDPLSVCWCCRKKAVGVEIPDGVHQDFILKLTPDEQVKFRHGVCYQHSKAGREETAKRAAVVKAAPDLLVMLKALAASAPSADEQLMQRVREVIAKAEGDE